MVLYWAEIEGRLEVVGTRVFQLDESEPLTASKHLRRIPWSDLMRRTREGMLKQAEFFGPGGPFEAATRSRLGDEADQYLAGAKRFAEFAAKKRRQRNTWSDEALEELARVYDAAYAAGLPVQAAIAEHFGIAKSTAGKKIMAARQAGKLPPAPGKFQAKGNPK